MTGTVRVGLLGCGVVGSATVSILAQHASELRHRTGAAIEVARIAVRDPAKDRGLDVPVSIWTQDPYEVVSDPSIDVVVELMGGVQPALPLLLDAIRSKKHVVTANKELLATSGRELMQEAERNGVDVLFEAAVAGGIPIIRPIRESLAGDRVTRILGIVNGTTNFILTRMSEMGESFDEALAQAVRLGYAESDPTADVEGLDAAAKIAILASLAFDAHVVASDVVCEGITRITRADIAAAHHLGYEVKLLGVAEMSDGHISARVHPAMIPRTHPLASVRDVYNAVFIQGEQSGDLMFFGRGAGGAPTAAAVVGDVVEIARNVAAGARSPGYVGFHADAAMRPQAETFVRYYIVLSVADQPGVLAAVAGEFARNDVSIASVRQEGTGAEATLMLITHRASEGSHRATLEGLRDLVEVEAIESTIRVEGTQET